MPAFKIVNRDARGQKRKSKLWQCFGEIGINPTHIKDGKGTYYAIVQQEKVEEPIKDDNKTKFRGDDFEIHTPLEYNAMRTIVIRNIDNMIADFNDDEVIDKIQKANTWAKVGSIYLESQIHYNRNG